MRHLIAIQAEMRLEHYESAGAFRAKILALTEEAAALAKGAPALLAFPENIGLPLALALEHSAAVRGARSVGQAVQRLLRRTWPEVAAAALRHRAFGPPALHLARALPAYRAYHGAFSEAARLAGATVVAGTAYLPDVDHEAASGIRVRGGRSYNTAFVYSPLGRPLGLARKAFLTAGAESRSGLSRGAAWQLPVFSTSVGRLGVAICLDAFHDSVIDRLDGLGAEIVVQPSANHASWERPWPPDRRLSEGEAWWRYGLRQQVQERLNIRYGVNPMLVGEVFDLRPRGRSSVVASLRHRPDAAALGWAGLLAVAAGSDREELVHAVVEGSPGGAEGASEAG